MADLNKDQHKYAEALEAAGRENRLGAEKRPLNAYGPCWCRSGKKWKFCHALRAREVPLTFGAVEHRRKAFYANGPCLHPAVGDDPCSNSSAIGSHTVQRRGGLLAIAEEGHVLSAKQAFIGIEKNKGHIDLGKIGVARASTFPGFCNIHDTALFKPVELPNAPLNLSNAFLLSFRAVAYELAGKTAQLSAHVDQCEHVDRGSPFEHQRNVQNYLFGRQLGIEKGLKDIVALKCQYDQAFRTQEFKQFNVLGVQFDRVLPFAAAGAFMPEFDFAGQPLQILGTGLAADAIALNITALGSKTCAVFGWFGGEHTPAGKFAKSFKSLPQEQLADAVLNVGMEYLENFFCKPSWWSGLSETVLTRLHEQLVGGLAGRKPEAIAPTAPSAVSGEVGQILDV